MHKVVENCWFYRCKLCSQEHQVPVDKTPYSEGEHVHIPAAFTLACMETGASEEYSFTDLYSKTEKHSESDELL
jgi:hypothetical protein